MIQDSDISNSNLIPAARHGLAPEALCPHATEVVRRLQKAGYEAYMVGGCVRDLLLGKAPKDFDVATDATPEMVKKVFPRAHLIGRRFRLAHVRLNGMLIEVATFRGTQTQSSHTNDDGRILRDNVWGSLQEDAIRRDFTINALFYDPVSGDIRDFCGGYEDLSSRQLRLIGDPETRYREDPVRLLRAARFVAKLGVTPVPGTADPIPGFAHLLKDIPPARLFEEVCKLFLTGHAEQTVAALQKYRLTRWLFPLLEEGEQPGQVVLDSLVAQAMLNTDQRIRESKSTTPAFLYAVLLWQPVWATAKRLQNHGATPLQALEQAGEEVILKQVRRTAIPRRFSAVTRQIWELQARLQKTHGRRALSALHHPRFRAGYDFLLLRADESEELEQLGAFWTKAQQDPEFKAATPATQPRKRRRRKRRRKPAADG